MFVEPLLPVARGRLVTVADDAPLIEAARLLGPGRDLVAALAPGGALAGVITKTDVVARIAGCDGGGCRLAAGLAMTRDVLSCHAGDGLRTLWEAMRARGLKCVPVIDTEGRPIGILTARDVLGVLLREAEDEDALLRDYVMGVGYR